MSEILKDKKVMVKPITRQSWLGKGHDGEFMYSGTWATFVLPLKSSTGRFLEVLSEEERLFFEDKLSLDKGALNFNNRKSEFWGTTFKIRLDKNTKELNLNDPYDNLTYRVMLALPFFAPSWAERNDNPEFKWAICDEAEETREYVKLGDKKITAYKFLGKIESDAKAMRNILKVLGKNPSATATKDFMVKEMLKLIEEPTSIDKVLSIAEDENYELKVLIEDAIECGALVKEVNSTKYRLGSADGDVIGEDRKDLIDNLKLKKNTSIYQRIKNQVENSKD